MFFCAITIFMTDENEILLIKRINECIYFTFLIGTVLPRHQDLGKKNDQIRDSKVENAQVRRATASIEVS